MNIKLPDGKIISVADGATAADAAKAISIGLAKVALAAKINDTLVDLTTPLSENDTLAIITFDSPEGKEIFWHSSSHIMAMAVKELFPSVKVTIGPAVESGFYYDFDAETPFTPDDLVKIEARTKEIAGRKLPFVRKVVSKDEAIRLFSEKGETYKVELINELPTDPSIYHQGDWFDLCRGPHIPDTSFVKAFKIMSVAGAYWRANAANKMLQRVYGISFPKQADLDAYVLMIEEAKKRDHRRIGQQLDLFSFHQEGLGFPFWHAKGMVLYNAVADYSRKEHVARNYDEIRTPIILNEALWHTSGHWDKYRDNMYFCEIDEQAHAVKPMNCPGGLLVYKNSPKSYRDLPLRNFEFGLVHRHEKAGSLHGLFRVRSFTQDDAHIFCTPDQIEPEIGDVIQFIFDVYRTMGFKNIKVELSTRPDKFIGDVAVWDVAEAALESVLKHKEIDYKLNPGDGAFYGPKIDFHIADCIGRTWQCGTIQLDFSMPARFGLEYTDVDGSKKCPVMIHRALLGSMERFIGILIENYAGFLPLWLAPVQAKILPISDKFMDYAQQVYTELRKAGIRVELDERAEKIGYKIRDAELNKVHYMIVVGEKEVASSAVSVRQHIKGDLGSMAITALVDKMNTEIATKALPE